MQTQRTTNQSIEFQLEKLCQFKLKLSPKINDANEVLKHVFKDLESIRKLQQFSRYLKIVQDVQEIR